MSFGSKVKNCDWFLIEDNFSYSFFFDITFNEFILLRTSMFFSIIKIRGIKQLKPIYDIFITAKKAHIRSRPNGSIIGIASKSDIFEHVQDEDEWHKINYKGQFGFTHQNNADLKLVDIANEYEYLDLVAIHPTTGSLYAMISVDALVKAPLNLASRKIAESGLVDGPK